MAEALLASDMAFDAADFCIRALDPHAASRPTAAELLDHPWLHGLRGPRPHPPPPRSSRPPNAHPAPKLRSPKATPALPHVIPRLSGSISRLARAVDAGTSKLLKKARESVDNHNRSRDTQESRASSARNSWTARRSESRGRSRD